MSMADSGGAMPAWRGLKATQGAVAVPVEPCCAVAAPPSWLLWEADGLDPSLRSAGVDAARGGVGTTIPPSWTWPAAAAAASDLDKGTAAAFPSGMPARSQSVREAGVAGQRTVLQVMHVAFRPGRPRFAVGAPSTGRVQRALPKKAGAWSECAAM